MRFKGEPNTLVSMVYRVGFVRKNKKIGRFSADGIFETNDTKVINRMKKHFQVIEEDEEIIITKDTIIKKETIRHCKKCDYTCTNQGVLMKHYSEKHPKE